MVDLQKKLQFLSLYQMVLADGVIQAPEMAKLYELGKEKFGLSQEAMNIILSQPEESVPTSLTDEEKVALLYEMAQIAWSDEDVDSAEVELLVSYARHFGVEESSIQSLIDFLFDCAKNNMSEQEVLAKFS